MVGDREGRGQSGAPSDGPVGAPSGLRRDVPLAPLTTLRLGGPARFLLPCSGVDELRSGLRWARRRELPVAVLGDGSNVIVPDDGFPGLVLHLQGGSAIFEAGAGDASTTRVVADGGMSWDSLVRRSVDRGLSGIECLSGIPGTVGAAPMQNVGAYGQELADTLTRVRCLDRQSLETRVFDRQECGFSYRDSRFKSRDRGRWIILRVELELREGVRPELRYDQLREALARSLRETGGAGYEELPAARAVATVRDTVLALRRRKSMVLDPDDPNSRSAGSFFLNPVLDEAALERIRAACRREGLGEPPTYPGEGGIKVPAAWLVERAGFRRGLRWNGVGVSENHALALVHYGGGSTTRLLALAEEIRSEVRDRFGVELEREPSLLVP